MLGKIANAVSNASNAVADFAANGLEKGLDRMGDVGEQAIDNMRDPSNLFDKDVFESVGLKDIGSSLWEGAKDVFKGEGSVGGMVGGVMDTIGLPEWAGDLVAGGVDFMMMNPKGYEHILSAASGIAGEAGMEDLSGFLDTASDVTGMAVDIGQKAAMTYFTGGTSMAGALSQAGGLGQLGQLAGSAGKVGEALETVMGGVEAFQEGDYLGAAGGLLGSLAGNFDGLDDILGGLSDSGVGELVQNVLGNQGSDLLGAVFEQFGPDVLSELPVGDILGELGLDTDALGGLAGPIVDIAKELIGGAVEDLPGMEILDSKAGQALLGALTDFVEGRVGDIEAQTGLPVSDIVSETGDYTQSMMEMAGLDEDVAGEILDTLLQVGSMAASSTLSDVLGVQVRV